jgi:hypothetical protein
MAEKAKGMLKKKDFYAWVGIIASIVYGLYLMDSWASAHFAPLSGFEMVDKRTDRLERKMDLMLLTNGVKVPPELITPQH